MRAVVVRGQAQLFDVGRETCRDGGGCAARARMNVASARKAQVRLDAMGKGNGGCNCRLHRTAMAAAGAR
jgi:hypothetical protein